MTIAAEKQNLRKGCSCIIPHLGISYNKQQLIRALPGQIITINLAHSKPYVQRYMVKQVYSLKWVHKVTRRQILSLGTIWVPLSVLQCLVCRKMPHTYCKDLVTVISHIATTRLGCKHSGETTKNNKKKVYEYWWQDPYYKFNNTIWKKD